MGNPYGVTQLTLCKENDCLDESYDFLGYLKGVLDAIGARVGAEELARATEDAELSLRIDGLTALPFAEIETILGEIGDRIDQEILDRIAGDAALSGQITTANSIASGAAASVVQEALDRATAISALASSLTTVTARVDSSEAAITTEQTARASADTALAGQITTTNARIGVAEASVVTEQTARATADTALATSVTTLTTRVGAAEAQITTESVARTAENYALATDINTLSASVDDAFAQITLANTARASGDSALSSQIGTVNTTLSGLSASVTSTATSVDGLLLRHSILLDSNGYVTGFVQNNNGTTGSFTVVADNFSIIAPAGGTPVTPFSVTAEGVRVNGNLVVSGSIGTGQLAANASTTPYSMSSSTPTALPGTTGVPVDLMTLYVTPTSASTTFVSMSADLANNSVSLSYNVQFQILINGSLLFTSENLVLNNSAGHGNSAFWSYAGQFSLAVGVANSIILRAVPQNSYGNSQARSVNKSIFALEIKR